jgi:hypothetical protein
MANKNEASTNGLPDELKARCTAVSASIIAPRISNCDVAFSIKRNDMYDLEYNKIDSVVLEKTDFQNKYENRATVCFYILDFNKDKVKKSAIEELLDIEIYSCYPAPVLEAWVIYTDLDELIHEGSKKHRYNLIFRCNATEAGAGTGEFLHQ